MGEGFEGPEAGAGVVGVDIVLVLMRYTCKISCPLWRCWRFRWLVHNDGKVKVSDEVT